MDIPEEDPNKSDQGPSRQIPESPVKDPEASNLDEDDDIEEINWELLKLTLLASRKDMTPTDPGTGQPLFSEPPPIPRIKELRGETLTYPPVSRRSSRKLGIPPDTATPGNSPEKSPEVTTVQLCKEIWNIGKELYESLPGSSVEALKQRTSHTDPGNLLRLPERHGKDQSAPNPNLGLRRSDSQGESAQSTILGLGGSDSQGESAQSTILGLGGSDSQGQSAKSPILGLKGDTSIMSEPILKSLDLSPLPPPVTPQAKRALEKSPSESGSSGSPTEIKRHRRVPSTVPEGHPADDVQRRRRLSHNEARGNEPVVKRELRKRSYSSGVEKTEVKQKQPKKEDQP